MKKVSTFFTVMTFVISLSTNAAYDDGPNVAKMIDVCTTKSEITTSYLERSLKEQYSKDIGSSLEIYGVTLKDYRPGLVSLFMALTRRTEEDHQYKTTEIFNNNDYKKCKDTICLADEIFGKGLGSYYLYILGNYNLNLSHLDNGIGILDKTKDRHYRVKKFTEGELKSILIPLKMLPISSLKRIEYNYPLKRINRHKGSTIANATMHLFNLWGNISKQEKMITIIHELGHVLADTISEEGADSNQEWASFSNWTWDRDGYFTIYNATRDYSYNNYVSGYAKSNPVEDFAESFTAYVVNPAYLSMKAPKKYNYIKEKVFGGLEFSNLFCKFDNEATDFTPLLDSLSDNKKSQIAKDCESSFAQTMSNLDMYPFNRCIAKSLLEIEELPLNNDPEAIQSQFENNKVVTEIKSRVVDLIIEDLPPYSSMELMPDHVLKYMKPSFGTVGFSSEILEVNKNIFRWMNRRMEVLNLEKNDKNAKKVIKEILLQRAK